MISFRCLPHDRLALHTAEVGNLYELDHIAWIEAGIARAVPTRLGVELRIGPYVGRLVIPGRVIIDVEEPYPGTVATCLALTTTGRRAADQPSPPGRVRTAPGSIVALRFERALSRYVRRGIERSYLPKVIVTSRPRGHVDVPRTAVQLASRGRTHQVVCQVRPLTEDTPLNRAVLAGAIRAEQLLLREALRGPVTALRRSLITLAGVHQDAAPNLWAARQDLDPRRDDHDELLSLTEILIAGVPALPRIERQDPSHPMSAWLSVELIFEEAVRAIVRDALPEQATVRAGRGDGTQLFSRLKGDLPALQKAADPDVVINLAGRTLIIDAKYRRHPQEFSEDELYQLIAHAGAYRAAAAALVAPVRSDQRPGHRWLGRDGSGIAYYLVAVDPESPSGMVEPIVAWLRDQLKQPHSDSP